MDKREVLQRIAEIGEVAARYGDEVLVGAGTVLDVETARACILAGVGRLGEQPQS